MDNIHAALRATLRADLTSSYHKAFNSLTGDTYLHNWHIELLADRLTQCMEGKIKRLIICVPPRSGKSLLASVAFPAWVMGHDPAKQIMTVSYAQRLSSEFCRQQMSLMQQNWYRELFPQTRLHPRKQTEEEFETTEGGRRIATSVSGTITGRGASMIIIDDIIKPQDALSDTIRASVNSWVEHTLLSRLNGKQNGVIIVIMQRVHHDDFVAHLMDKGGWELLNLPAIAVADESFALSHGKTLSRKAGEALHPGREPLEVLNRLEKDMTPLMFSTQYQQLPVTPGGNLIRTDWFQHFKDYQPPQGCGFYQSWDTATKCGAGNDYSACITWMTYEGNFYIIDIYRDKLEYPALRDKIVSHREFVKTFSGRYPIVVIEESPAAIGLIQDLQRKITLRSVVVKESKGVRAYNCSLTIHGGRVFLPSHEPWAKEFLAEVESFPNGRHDDQVDAMTLFLNWYPTRPVVRFGRARGMY